MPSMDPYGAATRVPDPDALEFIKFCYRRRRVGWPELYDEMCAVASRGLFRGYGADDLAERGIGFGLFEMPSLAAACRTVVAQEQALRRVAGPIAAIGDGAAGPDSSVDDPAVPTAPAALAAPPVVSGPTVVSLPPVLQPVSVPSTDRWSTSPTSRLEGSVRFAVVPSGA